MDRQAGKSIEHVHRQALVGFSTNQSVKKGLQKIATLFLSGRGGRI
jgi:hypothetical protein